MEDDSEEVEEGVQSSEEEDEEAERGSGSEEKEEEEEEIRRGESRHQALMSSYSLFNAALYQRSVKRGHRRLSDTQHKQSDDQMKDEV